MEVGYRVLHLSAGGNLVEYDAVALQPVSVREFSGKFFLEFRVIIYLSLLHVDHQHLAGAQASFLLHFRCFERKHSYLRRHYHSAVVGNQIACRAQAVSVKHATGIASVAEEQCGRTVPCLHED